MKTPVLAAVLRPLLAAPVLALASPTPAPPAGFFPDPPPGPPSAPATPGGVRRSADYSAAKTRRDGGKRSEKNETYLATETNQSAILVANGTRLLLANPTVLSSGSTSDEEASGSRGLNAAVLALTGGSIEITDGSINSSGHGATTVFAHGSGSKVRLARTKITASGPAARGLMAADQGAIEAVDLDVSTSGVRAAPVATGRGGGAIKVLRGRYRSTGTDSPAIHSTGEIELENADLLAADSEAAVVEGESSAKLVNCVLSGGRGQGVLLRQSLTGDAEDGRGVFEMTGGSLSAAEGPLFRVAGATGVIRLSGVTLAPASGKLLLSAADERVRAGSRGGDARLHADAQTLAGDLAADSDSKLSVVLENQSSLTGAIRSGALALDATSRWTATADSSLTTLAVANQDVARLVNIRSHGYLVTYDDTRPENRWLGGKTHPLVGGGRLAPAAAPAP